MRNDFVACFEYRHEAQAFEAALKTRLARFGLEVAVDKTKTLRFGHNGGPHNGRFDFLGFEFYWEPDRQGKPRVKRRTATKKHLAAMQRVRDWIQENRSLKQRQLFKTLKAKLQGTWNYYGLIGNYRRMWLLYQEVCRALYKWLNRRSQRKSLTWPKLDRLLEYYELPKPRIVQNRGNMPCQTEWSFGRSLVGFPLNRAVRAAHARAS